uniref:glycosyltransferase n=1 Tax=Cephaloticoccus sp. TaxID=1985742 RepID=UPI00404B4AB5
MTIFPGQLCGDVDTPSPIRAQGGKVQINGWCLLGGVKDAPKVRMATDQEILRMSTHTQRSDLAEKMPDQPAALHCGFTISGLLPPGIHEARLEAQLPTGDWQPFKTLVIAAESRPFSSGIDTRLQGNIITGRIHLDGWALDPFAEIESLELRYGHQSIPCTVGQIRTDLSAQFPATPHASRAGFKSSTILGAGYGPLRLRAKLSNDTTIIASTSLEVAIASDENVGPEIDLTAERTSLGPRGDAALPAKLVRTNNPLNVLFVLHGSFASNSALHVTALANELGAMGHNCLVAVTHDLATIERYRGSRFKGILHTDAAQGVSYANGSAPDIVHAWTTRENVRILSEQLRLNHPRAKLLVHLEDNEHQLLAIQLDLTAKKMAKLSDDELDRIVPENLSHPRRSREFLASVDGVTMINESLREFIPDKLPHQLLWPAADARCFYPRPPPHSFRRILDRENGEIVLFYHGNVHGANADEVRELYAAVVLLNQEDIPTTLIRTGLDTVDFLGNLASQAAPHVLSLGLILHHHHLPELMALADFFVQPGTADAFNNYRFPSKLPEFFALGRPVILPETNLGKLVQHGKDAYVLKNADAGGIALAIKTLRADPQMYERLSQGALAFARQHFSWRRSATELANFYRSLTT